MSIAKPLQIAALRQTVFNQTYRPVARRYVTSSNTSLQFTNTHQTFNQTPVIATIHTRKYSKTSSVQVLGWMRDKWESSEKAKQAAKLVDQIDLMANTPVWTVGMFKDEVDETLSSWKTKVPGIGGTSQVQAAKDTQKAVSQMAAQLGGAATARDVAAMDRKEKLKLAIACEMSMEEINVILNQFRQMDLMHRILRYRKENGLDLPKDQQGLKMAFQQDGMKILSNAEKKEMRETMAKIQQQ